MKIYTIGDSHSDFSFRNIIEDRHNIAPMTMHKVRRDKINFYDIFKSRNVDISYNSFVIFCFGEIDIRCHIFNQIQLNDLTEDEIINSLIIDYVNHIKSQKIFFEKIGILSITPPSKKNRNIENINFPFLGLDEDRSRYTIKANSILKELCKENDINFIDIYQYYADENGMLINHMSDGSVHIGNTVYVKNELKKHI
jgi:hypothetical protein